MNNWREEHEGDSVDNQGKLIPQRRKTMALGSDD